MTRRLPMFWSIMLAIAMALSAEGCKKKEPVPPTTPPPTESQVPAQPPPSTVADSTANAPAASADSAAAASTAVAPGESPLRTANETTPATSAAAAQAAPDVASGAVDGVKIYQTYCQTCHGEHGGGDGPAAGALEPKPASFAARSFKYDPNGDGTKGELEDIVAIVRDGAAKYGGSPLMTAWPMLTKEQHDAVAKYVKSLGGK